MRYVERDKASKKFLMAKSVRAVRASVQIDFLTVEVHAARRLVSDEPNQSRRSSGLIPAPRV